MKNFEVAINGVAVQQFRGMNDEEACIWAGKQRGKDQQSMVIAIYEIGSAKHRTALELRRTNTPMPSNEKKK